MSEVAGTHLSNGATELAPLRAKSGWIIALGVVYVLAGLVALGSVFFATVVTVFVVGIMMLIAGIAEVINSFQIKSWGKFLLWLLLGVLYILAGFVTFENPLLAAAVLTLLLGFALIVSGIMRLILAFNMKQEMPWVWVALSGVITASARLYHRRALAGLRPLYPRAVSRHRSRYRGRRLDRYRLRLAQTCPAHTDKVSRGAVVEPLF